MNLQTKQQVVLAISSVLLICSCARQAATSHEIGSETLPPQKIGSNTFIEISLDGGGLYAGVNPTTRNNKLIENDGRILIKFRQLYTGERDEMLFTSRARVERLARFIRDNGFFAMKDLYDCAPSGGECEYRKKKYPRPVPLRINVAIGNSERQVTVTIFKMGMVDYPDELEAIVGRIDEVIRQAREQQGYQK
ncbi:MAG: hypothetical protein JSV10_06295 [Candidatus Zixiibacteriota bacterium]|nr:MAG: hypothetical protein JSV10_06295 [candidate division Zixibacteria bacterium]